MSDVEVSLSTVILRKASSFAASTKVCRIGAGRAASVTMKASIVAMSGWIIPEPFAMPAILTSLPPMVVAANAPLGKVSVVMIASAAACHPSGAR